MVNMSRTKRIETDALSGVSSLKWYNNVVNRVICLFMLLNVLVFVHVNRGIVALSLCVCLFVCFTPNRRLCIK